MTRGHKRLMLLEEGRRQSWLSGVRHLSVDKIIQSTGISKRTLYKYFLSRDNFIAAVIEYDGECWREWFADAIRSRSHSKEQGIQLFFEVLYLWKNSDKHSFCLFARTFFEYVTPPDIVKAAAQRQLDRLEELLQELLCHSRISRPKETAAQLLLLLMPALSGVSFACGKDAPDPFIRLVHSSFKSCYPSKKESLASS